MSKFKELNAQTVPQWQGFHHLALITPDLDATIRFYTEVLGMTVLAQMPASNHAPRHCFIQPGATPAWGLHFFEIPDAQLFPYPVEMPRFAIVPGALQHIAFALPNLDAAMDLRERLAYHGIVPSDINTLGTLQNMLFHDNTGLLLEATWPKT